MNLLYENLKSNPIVYVTRDIERALGLPVDTQGYYIISNSTPFAKKIANERKNILLVENSEILDTWQLLEKPETQTWIEAIQPSPLVGGSKRGVKSIVAFKNSKKIETICEKNNWDLLNPSAEVIQNIEGKVTQEEFLPELSHLYPPHTISELQTTNYKLQTILQFNHSHTGEGTILLDNKKELEELKNKFPKREVRLTDFVNGQVYTNNNVVAKNKVLVGNISKQLTGIKPYTNNPFATVGNDWGAAVDELSEKQENEFAKIAQKVGEELRKKNWKGLFGIDVIVEKETGKLYLIEINARQPQSAVFESALQRKAESEKQKAITIFEAHLAALLNLEVNLELVEIAEGSQIIDRRNEDIKYVQKPAISFQPLAFRSNQTTLSKKGQSVLNNYLHLPFQNTQPKTPYFNNKKSKVRGGLRALIGKGSPTEIVEEAKILALKKKVDFNKLDEKTLTKFLVDHNIGVDCSGFVYHVLKAENPEKIKNLKFSKSKNPIRNFIRKFRPTENTSVKVLADDKNSKKIDLKDVQPGDLITIIAAGKNADRDHVLLIDEVQKNSFGEITFVRYTHSLDWSTDGKYNHGIRQGTIEINDINKPLIEQHWIESEKTGQENETYGRTLSGQTYLRRLKY